jgi:hypothetical protein
MQLNIDDLGVVGIVVEDWDITKEFKPKTLTTDYSSWITYISRKHVPANTPITDVEYWKPVARLQNDLSFDYNVFKEEVTKKMYNLTLLVDTFLESTEHGMAIANEFGNSTHISISQKLITQACVLLYSMIYNLQNCEIEVTEDGDIVLGIDDELPDIDPFRPDPQPDPDGHNHNEVLDTLEEIKDFLKGFKEDEVLKDTIVQVPSDSEQSSEPEQEQNPGEYPDITNVIS